MMDTSLEISQKTPFAASFVLTWTIPKLASVLASSAEATPVMICDKQVSCRDLGLTAAVDGHWYLIMKHCLMVVPMGEIRSTKHATIYLQRSSNFKGDASTTGYYIDFPSITVCSHHPSGFTIPHAQPSLFLNAVGSLTIIADMNVEVRVPSFPVSISGPKMFADFVSSVEADFILVSSDGKEFPVYSKFLIKRSKAFYDIYWATSDKRCIIQELNGKAFEVLVDFLYTGATGRIGEHAKSLLNAAVKFDLPELREAIGAHFSSGITGENAAQLKALADKLGILNLAKAVETFMDHQQWDILEDRALAAPVIQVIGIFFLSGFPRPARWLASCIRFFIGSLSLLYFVLAPESGR